MIREKDFTKITLKVNTSGRWANVCFCSADQFEATKAAATALANAHLGSIGFRFLDADGGCIEAYGRFKEHGDWRTGWHVPAR